MDTDCRHRSLAPRAAGASLFATLLLFAAASSSAQQTATFKGEIVDEETGDPIAGAIVLVRGREPVNADPKGRFHISDLAAGQIELTVHAIGYANRDLKLHLVAGQVLEQKIGMEFTGAQLPELEVTARAEKLAPRYTDFERRRQRGLGAYFRWEEIKAKGFGSVGDALRTVRGVKITCDQQTYECFAVMRRSPGCPPTWWVDGQEVHSFHENTSIRDVYGIEIYRGAAEIPADFGGSNAACGVIVLWTKSKPYR